MAANHFIEVATLTQEELTDRITVEGLVVRGETVVRAPCDGTLRPDAGGGERVGRGARLGLVRGAAAEAVVVAPHAGLVFWDVDGLEEVLQAGSVLAAGAVPVLRPETPRADQTVTRGQPLCRVADNLSPVLLHFNLPPGVLPQTMLRPDEYWRLRLGEEEFRGRVTTVCPAGGTTGVELEVRRYPDRLLDERRVSCAVITREMTGFVVPRRALVLRAGTSGLYLLCRDRIEWRPVVVEGQLGENVQVTGEALTEGCGYVLNPWLAADGRRYLKE